MGTGFYEVVAKAPNHATTDEIRVMLQKLLTERFKMVFHYETKEMPAYVLVEAKDGQKLKAHEGDDGEGVVPLQRPRMGLTGHGATLDQLAMFLSGSLRTPVVDMTGLTAHYDFQVDITELVAQESAAGGGPPDPVGLFQAALQKQLGLKLEARKTPVRLMVIDKLDTAPVEN